MKPARYSRIHDGLIALTLFLLCPLVSRSSEEAPRGVASLLSDLSPEDRTALLQTLNAGEPDQLSLLPGIEARKAETIIRSRPIDALDDLMLLPGFGEKTVRKIVLHALAGAVLPEDSP